jgi:thymidylate synthase (FAD)
MTGDICVTSEDILMQYKLDEYEGVIFIKPHAQFPVFGSGGGTPGWDWAAAPLENSYLPELNRYMELIGRVCYKSEDRITDVSASRFLKMLMESGHESVIEHIALSVKYVGSRAMSHQMVRHRLAAFSQESQRYCNYGKENKLFAVLPTSVRAAEDRKREFMRGVAATYKQYLEMLKMGVKPEDARYLLPNAVKTELVATLNLRQWRHVIRERGLNPRAQWEIRMITLRILDAFYAMMPEVFGDLWEEKDRRVDKLFKDLEY